ncbi:MAG: nucleotidyl transferase AbiEii/AbiGii toxin family protein [Deltaproteobacteria bacterium]|nr:nucleotidyl transferase AbiEii/AbiGii toxin family protein [Deltaproteobacteria bacterium]
MSDLKKSLKEIAKILVSAKKQKTLKGFTLVGGLAVSARAIPRATKDIDFLIHPEEAFLQKTLPDLLRHTNYTFKIFRSNFQDPLNNLVRIYNQNGDEIADLIPIFLNWQEEVIQRSENVELEKGFSIPIAQTEDLVVLKLKAGSGQDLIDVESLLLSAQKNKKLDLNRMKELAKRARVDKKLEKILLK